MPFILDNGGDVFTPGDPAHGVCVALDADTLEADPVWTRLDDPDGYKLASGWSISRGRQSELDKTGTGTSSVTFLDLGGVLDPTNTGSPFYGAGITKLTPMKQASIALRNPITDVWSNLFRGFVSSIDHEVDMWEADRGLDTVSMACADAFDLLSAMELAPGVHGYTTTLTGFTDVFYKGIPSNFPGEGPAFQHVDDRMVKLLDDAGFTDIGEKRFGMRNIFSGNVSLQGGVYSRRDQVLVALFDAADAEFPGVANLFMSKDGVFTFHGRYARFFPTRPGYAINSWKAGGLEQATADEEVAPIAGLQFRMSKDDIINACLALPQNFDQSDVPLDTAPPSGSQLVTDPASIEKYGWRSVSFDNLLTSAGHDDDANPTTALQETKKFAQYYVGNYATPRPRVSSIRFRPRGAEQVGAEALWALMCGVEIGDVIHLENEHPGGGGFDEDFYVEGIRYDASPARRDFHDISMELDVSPKSFFDYNPFGNYDDTVTT